MDNLYMPIRDVIDQISAIPTKNEHFVYSIYNAVKNIPNTPKPCLKELPLYMKNICCYLDKHNDPNGYLYTKLMDLFDNPIYLIFGDNEDVRFTLSFDSVGKPIWIVLVNYKIYTEEMEYDKYIWCVHDIFNYICRVINNEFGNKSSLYAKIVRSIPDVLTYTLLKEHGRMFNNMEKKVQDVRLEDKVNIKGIIDVMINLEDPIQDLIIDHGIVAV